MDGLSVLDDELFDGDCRLLGYPGRVLTELIHLVIVHTAPHTIGLLRGVLSLLRPVTIIVGLKMGLAALSMIHAVVVLGYKSRLECAVVVELVFLLLPPRLLDVALLFVVHLYSSLVETSSGVLNLLQLIIISVLTQSRGTFQSASRRHHLICLLLSSRDISLVDKPSVRDVGDVLTRQLIVLVLEELSSRPLPCHLLRFGPASLSGLRVILSFGL